MAMPRREGWVLWFTGIPGSGKTTIARAAQRMLWDRGVTCKILELDELRRLITPEPRYTEEERDIVYRALAVLASLLSENGSNVMVDATAHRRRWRDLARSRVNQFAEVYTRCSLDVARGREKGRQAEHSPPDIYAQAAQGAQVPGATVPYEEPRRPELLLDTGRAPSVECAKRVVNYVLQNFDQGRPRQKPGQPQNRPQPHPGRRRHRR
ncbi:MAG: adenylyl-sulfate kinase [Euryarchaeota archaeon]|nr:adenylyl-sulfate kinase [Euryarchaeota archaeon]